ncbi:MAG: DMP19 family protein, partial [Bacteroidota bacterium]
KTDAMSLEKILAEENATEAVLKLYEILPDTPDEGNEFEKNVLLVLGLDGQVSNGGFSQFFFNSTGKFAHETVDALQAIGATESYQLLKEAIPFFPKSFIPKDTGERRDLMDEFPEKIYEAWDQLDSRFYKKNENLDALVISYVRKNKNKFGKKN